MAATTIDNEQANGSKHARGTERRPYSYVVVDSLDSLEISIVMVRDDACEAVSLLLTSLRDALRHHILACGSRVQGTWANYTTRTADKEQSCNLGLHMQGMRELSLQLSPLLASLSISASSHERCLLT